MTENSTDRSLQLKRASNALEKQSSLTALGLIGAKGAAGWVGQNLLGKAHLKLKGGAYNKSLGGHILAGALRKNSDRSLATRAKGMVGNVLVPEVAMGANQAFNAGGDLIKRYAAEGMQSKRNLVALRRSISGDPAALKRIGLTPEDAAAIRKEISGKGEFIDQSVIDKVNKLKDWKDPSKLPSGTLKEKAKKALAPKAPVPPSGVLDQAVSTAATFALDPVTGTTNAAKLALGNKHAGKIPAVAYAGKKLTADPIANKARAGYKGGSFNERINQAKSILVNPYAAKAEKDAFRAGSDARIAANTNKAVKGKIDNTVESITGYRPGRLDEIVSTAKANAKREALKGSEANLKSLGKSKKSIERTVDKNLQKSVKKIEKSNLGKATKADVVGSQAYQKTTKAVSDTKASAADLTRAEIKKFHDETSKDLVSHVRSGGLAKGQSLRERASAALDQHRTMSAQAAANKASIDAAAKSVESAGTALGKSVNKQVGEGLQATTATARGGALYARVKANRAINKKFNEGNKGVSKYTSDESLLRRNIK